MGFSATCSAAAEPTPCFAGPAAYSQLRCRRPIDIDNLMALYLIVESEPIASKQYRQQ